MMVQAFIQQSFTFLEERVNKEYVPKIKKTIRKFVYVFIFELFFFLVFVGYQFLSWRKSINELNLLSNELTNKSVEFVRLSNLDKESKNFEDYIKSSLEKFYKKDEELSSLNSILSTLSKLNLKNINFFVYSKEKVLDDESKFEKLKIDLVCEGNISLISEFIKFIDNNEKIIKIENFLISNLMDGKGYELDLTFSIAIKSE